MSNIKKLPLSAMILMVVFSLAGIVSEEAAKLAPLTLLIGIVVFFITWKAEKAAGNGDGLDIRRVPEALKDKRVWFLIAMPSIMNLICYALAKSLVPEFLVHLKERTGFLSFSQVALLIPELIIAALGEEIAWRGFFQKQLTKACAFAPALVVSSALFALCHLAQGNALVVLYDLLFIFINAIFYGLIFRRTDNAYVSTLAHFAANLLGVIGLMLF